MTVTSINHNPNNESKFARHRSIWKGRHNQLENTILGLRASEGVQIQLVLAPLLAMQSELLKWGISIHATRLPPRGNQVLGSWRVSAPPDWLTNAIPESLRSDLTLIWEDLITVTARRIGFSSGAGASNDRDYQGDCLFLVAIGPGSFDFILSKYGMGENIKKNHHYYHWQARSGTGLGLVNVDDYTIEDGTTLYFISS